MIVSQRDSKWSSIKVGDGSATIGQVGCTITCLGYLVGLTPEKVNEKLKAVKGYQVNLVIWSKTAEAIGVASYRYTTYNNDAVVDAISKNGAVLGEVDAKAIGGTGKHWVVMTGNGKVQDPWFGEERPTSNYTFTGYTIVVFDKTKLGKYEDINMYRGYDLTNRESMKVCVDQQIKVVEGLLVDKSQYESVKGQLTESQKRNDELSSELGAIRGELKDAIQKIDNQNQVISSYVNEDAVQLETLKRLERENGVILDDYLDLRDPIATELKVSIGSESRQDSNTKILGALQSQIQMSVSLQNKVSELEKEVKRLNTHKKPIEKLSTKSLIIYLLQRLMKRS